MIITKFMEKRLLTMVLLCGMVTSYGQNLKFEAEDATYANCTLITDAKYSGGKALQLTENNAKITFRYNSYSAGKQTVYVGYDALYGSKVVNVRVNGNTSTLQTGDKVAEEAEAGTFIMHAGENVIEITPNWTWFRIDYIRIENGYPGAVEFNISRTPVDVLCSLPASKMYDFLYRNFGKRTIAGMMTGDMATANGDVTSHADMKAVYAASGKYPALVGFDLMNVTGKDEDQSWNKEYNEKTLELVRNTYRKGGIPAITWHWRDPSRRTNEFYYDKDGKDGKTTVKISDAMNPDGTWNTASPLYQQFIRDIDTIADLFLKLQDAGIACIFRPLHEASGGWFWWGADGARSFVRLYRLISDEMVMVKGVHNLIWVWNPCKDTDGEWTPGTEYFDVVSIDIYNNDFDYSSNYTSFDRLKVMTEGKKLIALSENGPIPDIDNEFDEDAVWSWWMPWYQTWNGRFVDKTSQEEWRKCMNDNRVITLDDVAAGWDNYTDVRTMKAACDKEQLYDLQGRQVAERSQKGICIKGHKKLVVR